MLMSKSTGTSGVACHRTAHRLLTQEAARILFKLEGGRRRLGLSAQVYQDWDLVFGRGSLGVQLYFRV